MPAIKPTVSHTTNGKIIYPVEHVVKYAEKPNISFKILKIWHLHYIAIELPYN